MSLIAKFDKFYNCNYEDYKTKMPITRFWGKLEYMRKYLEAQNPEAVKLNELKRIDYTDEVRALKAKEEQDVSGNKT